MELCYIKHLCTSLPSRQSNCNRVGLGWDSDPSGLCMNLYCKENESGSMIFHNNRHLFIFKTIIHSIEWAFLMWNTRLFGPVNHNVSYFEFYFMKNHLEAPKRQESGDFSYLTDRSDHIDRVHQIITAAAHDSRVHLYFQAPRDTVEPPPPQKCRHSLRPFIYWSDFIVDRMVID